MHYKEVKGILSPSNGMNLYRGCSHGCIYCDSRSLCYRMDFDFEDIEVKKNAPELLESALIRKRRKCMISTGSMCDPYMPLENKILNTQKSLELIYKYDFGITIITKSNLILRDLELLKRINEKTKCVVQMTLTTFDESLCKIVEPNVCTTKERFEALKILNENNIPTVVWLCPVLPFVNDTEENILGILDYCVQARVYGIICFGMGLTLRERTREYFYKKLDEHFPGLKQIYQRKYGNVYSLMSDRNDRLMSFFYDKCKKHGIVCNNEEIFKFLHTYEIKNQYEQLSLF